MSAPGAKRSLYFAMQIDLPNITDQQKHFDAIRNLYWLLRNLRPWQTAKRRKLYRQIQKQKAVLISCGLDPELLRLWCRQWTACKPEAATARYHAYLQKTNTEL